MKFELLVKEGIFFTSGPSDQHKTSKFADIICGSVMFVGLVSYRFIFVSMNNITSHIS